MIKRLAILLILGVLVTSVTGLLPSTAHAQQQGKQWASSCSDQDRTIGRIFCSISTEFRWIPKTLSVIAYATAVVLLMTGLLNLKTYGDDPTAFPLRSIIMKFVLAGMLIALPLVMQLVVASMTGQEDVEDNPALKGRPCLMKSNLMSLRKGGGTSACN